MSSARSSSRTKRKASATSDSSQPCVSAAQGWAFTAGTTLTLLKSAYERSGDERKAALAEKMAKDAMELEGIDKDVASSAVNAFHTAIGIVAPNFGGDAGMRRGDTGHANSQLGARINVNADGSIAIMAGALPRAPTDKEDPPRTTRCRDCLADSSDNAPWTCKHCTFHNETARLKCGMCYRKKEGIVDDNSLVTLGD